MAISAAALVLSACGGGSSSSDESDAGDAPASSGKEVQSVVDLLPKDARGKTFSNAVYTDYEPQMFLKNDKLQGIQVDLAAAVAEVAGIKFKNEAVGSFDAIIPGMAAKRYDLASSDFGITTERVKAADFVSQFDMGTGFVVNADSTLDITEVTDLCGKKVAAVNGSYYVDQLKTIGKDCVAGGQKTVTVLTLPTYSQGILAVTSGRVDASAGGVDQIGYVVKQQSDKLKAGSLNYGALPLGIGFPKGSPLVKATQAAMQELIKNGTYETILKKWGIEQFAYTDPAAVRINDPEPFTS